MAKKSKKNSHRNPRPAGKGPLPRSSKPSKAADATVVAKGPTPQTIFQAFYHVLDQISDQAETIPINNTVLDAAFKITGAAIGFIGEVDAEGIFKIVTASEKGKPLFGTSVHDVLSPKSMPFKGHLARILEKGQIEIINDPDSALKGPYEGLMKGHPEQIFKVTNIMIVPFMVLGKVPGAIVLTNKEGGFSDQDAQIMTELARLISVGRSKILALSAAIRNTSEGIALMDRNGVLSLVNPALERMFQYKTSELEGRSLLGIFLEPNSGSPLGEAIAGAVMNGTWSGEALGLRRDGMMFPVHMTVSVIEEGTAPRTGFMLIVRDISVEKEAQDRSRSYLEATEAIIMALDLEGRITMVNRKSEDVLGRTRHTLVGTDWFETCVPNKSWAKAKQAFDSMFDAPTQGPVGPINKGTSAGGVTGLARAINVEGRTYPLTDAHGNQRLIHWEHSPLRNHKGLVTGAIFTGTDITEQHLIEDKLRASEEIYRAVLHASPDAILWSDLNAIIQDCSMRSCELFGTEDPMDIIGKKATDFIHPDEQEKALRTGEKVFREGLSVRSVYNLRRKAGGYYRAELTSALIKDHEGKPFGFLGIIRDLSEKEVAAAMLEEAEQRYRTIFENSPVSIIRIRLTDGTILFANKVAAENWGFSSVTDLLNQGDLFKIITREKALQIKDRLQKTGQLKDFEVEFVRPDGTKGLHLIYAKLKEGVDHVDMFGLDISKAKAVETKLKETERAFAGLMDTTFLGFIRFRITDGKILFANTRLIKMWGYDNLDDFITNVSSRDIFTDEQRQEIKTKLIKDGVLPNYETPVRTKDGKIQWALVYTRLDRQSGFVDTISVNITAQKEIEQKLRDAEKMYKDLFNTITTAVARVDLTTGRMLMANDAALQMLGYSSFEELADAFSNNPKLGPRMNVLMERLEKDGLVKDYETNIPKKDGSEALISVSAILDRTKHHVTFSAVDLTGPRALESRLKNTEMVYKHLFDNTPVGISRLKVPEWTVVLANKAVLDILGASTIDDLNDPAIKDIFYPKDMAEEFMVELQRVGQVSNIEVEVTRMDGSKRTVLAYASLDPSTGHLDNVIIDITRLKDAERRLSEAEGTYWQMFKAATVGQARVGVDDGKVQVCNEAFARMLGYNTTGDLLKDFKIVDHVKDMDLWNKKVASHDPGLKGIGWLPTQTSPPTVGTRSTDPHTTLIGFIPGVKVLMVRNDGKELTTLVSGVVYMGKGYMDLTIVDERSFGS